jgi:hypothetical protein
MVEENNQVRPGFIGVYIPGEVLFNPHISSTEKLLFGFINNLAKSGRRGCFASNRYLGNFTNQIPTKVSLSIKNLLDFKYITIKYIQKNNQTQETERQIFVDDTFHERYSKVVILINEIINSGNFVVLDNISKAFLQCKDGVFNEADGEGGLSEKIRGISKKDKQKEEVNKSSLSFFIKTKKDNEQEVQKDFVLPSKRIKNSEKQSSDDQNQNEENKKEKPPTVRGSVGAREKSYINECNTDLKETQAEKSKNNKKPSTTFVPETIKPFIAVWESNGFKVSHNGTNQFSYTVKALKNLITGNIFKDTEFPVKSYTLPDFISSVNRLKLSMSPDYYPLNKSYLEKITIHDFLYNPYSKSKSLFITMLSNEPKPVREKEIDYNPNITTLIIGKYKKEVLKGFEYEPTTPERSKFILAASKLSTFFEVNSKKVSGIAKDVNKQVDLLWLAIEQETKSMRTSIADITPGFFCSDLTFSRRLPAYLAANNYLKGEGNGQEHFSIYR